MDIQSTNQTNLNQESNNEKFLDSIIENIPNMIFVKDASELRFLKFNKAGEDLLGYKKEELIGKNDYDFFPKDQADFFIAKDRAVLSSKIVLDIPEEIIQTKYHGERILHTKKIPIFDEKGNPKFLLGISEDITDIKKAEKDLKIAHDKLKTMLNAIPDLMFEVDIDGKITDYHASHDDLLYTPAEQFLGKTVAEILPPNVTEVIMTSLKNADKHGHDRGSVYTLDLPSGKHWFELSVSKETQIQQNKVSFLAIVRDITERIQSEEAMKKHSEELQRINNLMVGRELKMIELKKELDKKTTQNS